jgi:predicted amidohydrolase
MRSLVGAAATYVAAVAQHDSVTASGANATLAANLAQYESAVETAVAGGAQLIAFPEWGLFGDAVGFGAADTLRPYCPLTWSQATAMARQPGLVPCDAGGDVAASALGAISCLARRSKIDIVYNDCVVNDQPGAQAGLFNVDFAVLANGTVAAAYRKTHVFFHSVFDEPSPPRLVSFVSSFGVRFGMFVCKDILFPNPSSGLRKLGITEFVTSAQINLVGGGLGRTAFRAWSVVHGANLVAANGGKSASGIFARGKSLTANQPSAAPVLIAKVARGG